MMKLNCLLLLAFLTMVAGGCATTPNYHGPEHYGSPENLPPALWDNVLNGGETNTPVSPIACREDFNGAETKI